MIDKATVNAILDRTEIYDVVSDFVSLRRRGANYVGLCPFHSDKRPSFYVSPSKNICKCFACGEGGTPLNFLIKHENISYAEALRYLAKKYGIPIVEKELSDEEKAEQSEREQLFLTNSIVRDAFVQSLHQSGEGRMIGLSYFKERQFTEQSIEKFQLGYSPATPHFLSALAKEKGLELKALEVLGLIYPSKTSGEYTDRFRERVIFPIHSISGNVVGFGGRVMKQADKLAKYINSPDSPIYNKGKELYGIYFAKHAITKHDKCLIVEGYTDVISLHQAGIENVVASSGTALTVEQCRLIKRFTDQVTLVFDSDAAGIKAAIRGINLLLDQDMNVRIVLLPEGHDPDSFAKSHSREAIEEYISKNEEDFIRFRIRLGGAAIQDPSQRVYLINDIAKTIAHISDSIKREVYLQDAADLLGMSLEALAGTVSSIRKKQKQEEFREKEREELRQQRLSASSPEETALSEPQPTITPQSPKTETASLQKGEYAIIKYLVQYGNLEIEEMDPSTQTTERFTLLDLILAETQDLRESNDLSATFEQIISLCQESIAHTHTHTDVSKALLSDPNDNIRKITNHCLIDGYNLSRLHDQYEQESSQARYIFKALMTDILSLKYLTVEKRITERLVRLKSLTSSAEDQKVSEQLTAEILQLNKLKSMISEGLGDRVITPKNLLI